MSRHEIKLVIKGLEEDVDLLAVDIRDMLREYDFNAYRVIVDGMKFDSYCDSELNSEDA